MKGKLVRKANENLIVLLRASKDASDILFYEYRVLEFGRPLKTGRTIII
jgi:hypothetical protein